MVDTTWNRLSLMIQQGELSSTERIQLLLNSGLDAFHMDVACLTRMDKDCLTVMFSNASKWQGSQFSLYQTLCQFTIEHRDVVADNNLENIDWDDYGIIEGLRFAAYIGVPIYFKNKLYGTLFFASYSSRLNAFIAREEAFIKVMASSFGNLINQQAIN